jgi:hypothetical protein
MPGYQAVIHSVRLLYNVSLGVQVNIKHPPAGKTSQVIMMIYPAIKTLLPFVKIQLDDMPIPGECLQVPINGTETYPR